MWQRLQADPFWQPWGFQNHAHGLHCPELWNAEPREGRQRPLAEASAVTGPSVSANCNDRSEATPSSRGLCEPTEPGSPRWVDSSEPWSMRSKSRYTFMGSAPHHEASVGSIWASRPKAVDCAAWSGACCAAAPWRTSSAARSAPAQASAGGLAAACLVLRLDGTSLPTVGAAAIAAPVRLPVGNGLALHGMAMAANVMS
mmetsp:Transcript_61647/g.180162  ORF Transcript_61647/g.180162 Transcript_61647/m.180162 type:complete len:200 (+) Transcript_61647:504-1103(+)